MREKPDGNGLIIVDNYGRNNNWMSSELARALSLMIGRNIDFYTKEKGLYDPNVAAFVRNFVNSPENIRGKSGIAHWSVRMDGNSPVACCFLIPDKGDLKKPEICTLYTDPETQVPYSGLRLAKMAEDKARTVSNRVYAQTPERNVEVYERFGFKRMKAPLRFRIEKGGQQYELVSMRKWFYKS